ncbi:MAG: hypothetical protein ACJ78Z_19090 [Myxococcales bacterium]
MAAVMPRFAGLRKWRPRMRIVNLEAIAAMAATGGTHQTSLRRRRVRPQAVMTADADVAELEDSRAGELGGQRRGEEERRVPDREVSRGEADGEEGGEEGDLEVAGVAAGGGDRGTPGGCQGGGVACEMLE